MSDDDQAANDGATGDSAGTAVTTTTAGGVNSQILDAVKQSTTAVMSSAPQQAAATSYQKVLQATAFAVQDATDYLRNIENVAMTGQGVIVAKMLADETTIPIYTPVLAVLQEMVVAATTNLATVGATSTTIATSYPSKAS